MKKSKYVTKYDYLNYYCSQPSFWFFTNAEIHSALKAQKEILSKKNEDNELNQNDLNDDIDDDEHIDSTDFLDLLNWNEIEYKKTNLNDYYSKKYFYYLEKNKDIDEKNPLIVEGRKIDSLSKQYIANYYINKYPKINFEVYDFDNEKTTLEKAFKKTEELLTNNKNIIIFQPAFINPELNIVTKCDGLVKINSKIKIIETKGTTTCKLIHFLDLFYQKNLLESVEYLSVYDFEYKLCLVDYTIAKKNQIDFTIVNTINLSKNVSLYNKNTISEKRKAKQGNKGDTTFFIDDALEGIFENDKKFLENIKQNQKVFDVLNNFEKTIKELNEHKSKMKLTDIIDISFEPNKNDNSEYKQNSFWPELKKIYSLKGFENFKYSGNLVDQTSKKIDILKNKKDVIVFKDCIIKKNINFYFEKGDKFQFISKQNVLNHINEIKPNKVYFDFETISTAMRVIDDSLPFCQIVTQCSIIKTKNNNFKNLKCNNMMIDPKKVDVLWFKSIVDNLYEGENYSYIVYNKSFEMSRLKEMINYINDEQYAKKINVIISNLYDLADFFDIRKDLLFALELYGFYSIKKVLPLIKKYNPYIFEITECKDYLTLNISNGLECQQKSTLRFLCDDITDQEWEKIMEESKIYCENDVRAMVAVELFIKDIFENFESKYSKIE